MYSLPGTFSFIPRGRIKIHLCNILQGWILFGYITALHTHNSVTILEHQDSESTDLILHCSELVFQFACSAGSDA